jgi:hypothetical protein
MKSLAVLAIVSLASSAIAAQRSSGVVATLGQPSFGQAAPTPGLAPVPDQAYVTPSAPVTAAPVALYCNVKYRDQRNIAPCAVSKIVQVPDPCNPCCCVNVEICVPPCACECVRVSKCGTRVTYNYGKYQVQVTSRHGRVVVDYDD